MSKTIEQKEKLRDWWYSIQDAGYELPETKRVELEHIFQERDRIAREEAYQEGYEEGLNHADCFDAITPLPANQDKCKEVRDKN